MAATPASGSIIFLHLGQAGVQAGSSIWKLFCAEHNLSPEGKVDHQRKGPKSDENEVECQIKALKSKRGKSGPQKQIPCQPPHSMGSFKREYLCQTQGQGDHIDTLFSEHSGNRYRPRALFIDLEPNAIEGSVLSPNSQSKSLFAPKQLIMGKEDSSTLYARGYYSRGAEFLDVSMARINTAVEASSSLQGFVLCRSCAGGTGSGLGNLILNELKVNYPKAKRVTLDFFPAWKSPANGTHLDPYNVILSTNRGIDNADVSFPFENDALSQICENSLYISNPTYSHYNRVIAQITSALFAPMQFRGTLNRTLSELQENCVTYPRLHYPILQYAPLVCPQLCAGKALSVSSMLDDLVLDRTGQVIVGKVNDPLGPGPGSSSNQRESVSLQDVAMAYNIIFRGKITKTDVVWAETALEISEKLCDQVKFIDWTPGETSRSCLRHKDGSSNSNNWSKPMCKNKNLYKIGLCPRPPSTLSNLDTIALSDQAAIGILNSTGISNMWRGILEKFEALFKRKAFVHWYTMEGMEESEFTESQNNVQALIDEYDEISEAHPRRRSDLPNNSSALAKVLNEPEITPEKQNSSIETENNNELPLLPSAHEQIQLQ